MAAALLSMTIGNCGALLQSNVKRMMAYSSIAHAGYILVALAARSEIGTAAAMFYLAAYACMNIGVFAVMVHISGKGERHLSIKDFSGLALKEPLTAGLLTVLMLSLIGVPLTGGFFGKFYIFKAALQSNLVWLTVLGLVNSAIAILLLPAHPGGDVHARTGRSGPRTGANARTVKSRAPPSRAGNTRSRNFPLVFAEFCERFRQARTVAITSRYH